MDLKKKSHGERSASSISSISTPVSTDDLLLYKPLQLSLLEYFSKDRQKHQR